MERKWFQSIGAFLKKKWVIVLPCCLVVVVVAYWLVFGGKKEIIYENGDVYVGEAKEVQSGGFVVLMPHGYGTMIYKNGTRSCKFAA